MEDGKELKALVEGIKSGKQPKKKKDYRLGSEIQGEYKAKELLETARKQIKGSSKEILRGIKAVATPFAQEAILFNKLRNKKKKANFQKGDYSDIKTKKADGGRMNYKHGGAAKRGHGCEIK